MTDLLHVVTCPPSEMQETQISQMFDLMRRYYDGVERELFLKDLNSKQHVVSVLASSGELVGFSTVAVWDEHFEGQKFRVLFSGDTIIERAYWGSTTFASEWIRLVARVKSSEPHIPLIWLLVVKGHRTYRHLPVFMKSYFPAWDVHTPPATQKLIDHIAGRRFGKAYDPTAGLLRFPDGRGSLKAEWAAIPDKDSKRPEVSFFVERNPDYTHGDELVCLTEINASNLKPFARRIFEDWPLR
jgi:hypothetical protein